MRRFSFDKLHLADAVRNRIASGAGERSPSELWGRFVLYSTPQCSISAFACNIVNNDFEFFANGKLVVNAYFEDPREDGSEVDIELRVWDAAGNLIVGQADQSMVANGLYAENLVIPVVSQEEYFIEVFFTGEEPDEPIQHVAIYDLEIENFAFQATTRAR